MLRTTFVNKRERRVKSSKAEDRTLSMSGKIAPAQDDTEGFAITEEMRSTQLKMNRMIKYQMLTNKKHIMRKKANCFSRSLREKWLSNTCKRSKPNSRR